MIPTSLAKMTMLVMMMARRDALVIANANRWHVPQQEMLALARVENYFGKPNAISKKGAVGPLQVMPGWVNTYQKDCGKVNNLRTMADTVKALEVPEYNICLGTHIFRSYLRSCHNVLYCARARYNGARHFTTSARIYNRRVWKQKKGLHHAI